MIKDWVAGSKRFKPPKSIEKKAKRSMSLSELLPHVNSLLFCVAVLGNDDLSAAEKAYLAGFKDLGIDEQYRIPIEQEEQASLQLLDRSLQAVSEAPLRLKKRFLEACINCVISDSKFRVHEAELLRAIADTFECPLPPIATPVAS